MGRILRIGGGLAFIMVNFLTGNFTKMEIVTSAWTDLWSTPTAFSVAAYTATPSLRLQGGATNVLLWRSSPVGDADGE